MEVRLLEPGDEPLLVQAAKQFNDVEMSGPKATALLADPDFVIVAALDDARAMLGRIYGHVLHRLDQSDLFIYEVDVAEVHKRKGAGRAMIERLKTFVIERGLGEMFVLTELSNVEGNGLYSATGAMTEGSPANIYVWFNPDR